MSSTDTEYHPVQLYVPPSGRINAARQLEQAQKYANAGREAHFHLHAVDEDCNDECKEFKPNGSN